MTTCTLCDTALDLPQHADEGPIRYYCEPCAKCDLGGDWQTAVMCDTCGHFGSEGRAETASQEERAALIRDMAERDEIVEREWRRQADADELLEAQRLASEEESGVLYW